MIDCDSEIYNAMFRGMGAMDEASCRGFIEVLGAECEKFETCADCALWASERLSALVESEER